jgi:hypothetical protein
MYLAIRLDFVASAVAFILVVLEELAPVPPPISWGRRIGPSIPMSLRTLCSAVPVPRAVGRWGLQGILPLGVNHPAVRRVERQMGEHGLGSRGPRLWAIPAGTLDVLQEGESPVSDYFCLRVQRLSARS